MQIQAVSCNKGKNKDKIAAQHEKPDINMHKLAKTCKNRHQSLSKNLWRTNKAFKSTYISNLAKFLEKKDIAQFGSKHAC